VNLKRHLSVTITTCLNCNGFMVRSPLKYLINTTRASQIVTGNRSVHSHPFSLSSFHSIGVQFFNTDQEIQHLLTSTHRYHGSFRSSSKRT
jgi:hypothetical protein